MEVFKVMWDAVITLYSIQITVFGAQFTFMQMFIFFTLLSLAIGVIVGLFKS